METRSGNVLENTRSADWERELVTHYTGIGTEVRENYRDGSLQNARVVVKSLQGERRKNKFTCFYDRAAAAYAEGVHMPQGLGRYGVSDVILSDSEESSNTQPNEFYLKNHLGSTMLVYGTQGSSNADVADLGEVKKAYDYRSFGEQIDLIADAGDKVTENFTGICPQGECCENTLVYFHCRAAGHSALRQEKDDETELNYFGARYLDPMLGLWTSVDPKRQFASPYLYVGNGYNPVNGVDPDGNYYDDEDAQYVYNTAKYYNFGNSPLIRVVFNDANRSLKPYYVSFKNYDNRRILGNKVDENGSITIFLNTHQTKPQMLATAVHELIEFNRYTVDGQNVSFNPQPWHVDPTMGMNDILDKYGSDHRAMLKANYEDKLYGKSGKKYPQDDVYKAEYEALLEFEACIPEEKWGNWNE